MPSLLTAVGQRVAVAELDAAPEQTMLGGRDVLPVQHLQLDGLDRVSGRNVQREGPAGGGLDEDLYSCSRACFEVLICMRLTVCVRLYAWVWVCVSMRVSVQVSG